MLDNLETEPGYASLLRLVAGKNGEKERRGWGKGKERLDLRSEDR